jgi:hypothetical protein
MKTSQLSAPLQGLNASPALTCYRAAGRALRAAALLSVLTVGSAAAQVNDPVTVQQVNPTSLRVRIENSSAPAGQVQVVSLVSGNVLFDESYEGAAYGHRFDFRELKPGRYALLMKTGGEQHRYLIQVQQDKAQKSVAVRTVKRVLPEAATASL